MPNAKLSVSNDNNIMIIFFGNNMYPVTMGFQRQHQKHLEPLTLIILIISTVYYREECARHVLSTLGSNIYACPSVSLLPVLFTAFCLIFYHLQGLLRTTLPHPKAERSYAQYEITQLLPGIELFSDIYRANICSVVASLYYVIRELHFAKQNIIVSNW